MADDCLIVGGGVVGLSLAYELAGHGVSVAVCEAGEPGQEASWAGAGILPPAGADSADPVRQFTALSNRLHRDWSAALADQTGIDNGLRACGGVYLARQEADVADLDHCTRLWRQEGLQVEAWSAAELAQREPALCPTDAILAAYWLPGECQVRNPRHLKALLAACLARGVRIEAGSPVVGFESRGSRVTAARTAAGARAAGMVCLAGGAWTGSLAEQLHWHLRVYPVRGQMVLLSTLRPVLSRVINEGPRYLVPRDDGRLLVGSTEEDAGFDRRPTGAGVQALVRLALELAPVLAAAQFERAWAGLRPATGDGLPYLGLVPGWDNAWVAAGHFRSGLQWSTGTALVLGQLMRGLTPSVDLGPFRPDRLAPLEARRGVREPRG
jgi:glycine oxidase